MGLLAFVSSPLHAVFRSVSSRSVFLPPLPSLIRDFRDGFRVDQSDLHNNALICVKLLSRLGLRKRPCLLCLFSWTLIQLDCQEWLREFTSRLGLHKCPLRELLSRLFVRSVALRCPLRCPSLVVRGCLVSGVPEKINCSRHGFLHQRMNANGSGTK